MASRLPPKQPLLPDEELSQTTDLEQQVRVWFAQLAVSRSAVEQMRLAAAIRDALAMPPCIEDEMFYCDFLAASEDRAWDAAAAFRSAAQQQIVAMQASDNCERRHTSGRRCSAITAGEKYRRTGGVRRRRHGDAKCSP